MESPSFDKRHLIALGDKVALVLVPRRYALVEGHCYIVPLAYSTSFLDLDEEAWYEVSRFQTSLSQMFQKKKMGLIFLETACHASKSGTAAGGGTQCKMEVIPVSRRVEEDAPFYFKSSLEGMAQEWGTHQKLIVLKDRKSLRNAVPKGFPYFYCGWDGGGGGYVQLIEGEDDGLGGGGREGGGGRSKYRDFGLDTVAGMMGLDPYRMRRKSGSGREAMEQEKREILKFCETWKEVDWTTELDG
jgi:diadenosine tetraphosphate (Ap4A) HIT family hydrolase